jgi:hypothetical protein
MNWPLACQLDLTLVSHLANLFVQSRRKVTGDNLVFELIGEVMKYFYLGLLVLDRRGGDFLLFL